MPMILVLNKLRSMSSGKHLAMVLIMVKVSKLAFASMHCHAKVLLLPMNLAHKRQMARAFVQTLLLRNLREPNHILNLKNITLRQE